MTETKAKTRTWVKVLLVASLGANLIVAGLFIGLVTRPPMPPNQFRGQETVAFLTTALPDQPRRDIRSDLLEHRRQLTRSLNMENGIRRELLRALTAEPFDIERVTELLGLERDQFVSLGELAHESLLREIGELDETDRAAFVERVEAKVARLRAQRGQDHRNRDRPGAGE